MKNIYLFLLALVCLSFNACNHDDDNDLECEECKECEECEELPGYKNYTVDFFSTHKDFVIIPTIYETVTEQVQLRPAHQEGATFETVTEQYLVKEPSVRNLILEKETIHLVTNSETDSVATIDCYHFFDEADFIQIEIPAEYSTRSYQVLLLNGTGAEVPAEYGTVTRKIVVALSEVVPNTEAQVFTPVGFRVVEDRGIESYLIGQFAQQLALDCFEGNGYRIND